MITKDNVGDFGPFGSYRKKSLTRAIQMAEPFQCLTIQGNVAAGAARDYLCIDNAGWPYPCDRVVFETSHEKAEGAE